jgi:hypothetical protein
MDCVVMSIDQQCVDPDGFDGIVDSFQILNYHIGVQMVSAPAPQILI